MLGMAATVRTRSSAASMPTIVRALRRVRPRRKKSAETRLRGRVSMEIKDASAGLAGAYMSTGVGEGGAGLDGNQGRPGGTRRGGDGGGGGGGGHGRGGGGLASGEPRRREGAKTDAKGRKRACRAGFIPPCLRNRGGINPALL